MHKSKTPRFGMAAGIAFTLPDVLIETTRPAKPKKEPAPTETPEGDDIHA